MGNGCSHRKGQATKKRHLSKVNGKGGGGKSWGGQEGRTFSPETSWTSAFLKNWGAVGFALPPKKGGRGEWGSSRKGVATKGSRLARKSAEGSKPVAQEASCLAAARGV